MEDAIMYNNNTNAIASIMAETTTAITGMNMNNSKSGLPAQSRMMPEYILQMAFVLEDVLLPIVCSLGILGNGLSLCVLTRREMAGAATCFLTGLAVSDFVLLSLQVPSFFKLNKALAATDSFRLFFRYYTVIRYVLNNVFITCTGWLTVAVTVERFISLRFMMHPKLVCTVNRARKVIVAIFLFSFMFHFSKFFEYVPNPDLKSHVPLLMTYLVHSPAYEAYLHIANIALAAIIPVFILFLADFFLIYFLVTHRQRMLRHNKATGVGGGGGSGAASSSSSSKGKSKSTAGVSSVDMIHVTAIVVATVLVFIACHSVGVYMAISISTKGRKWAFRQPVFIALKYVNTLLVMVNSSVNFLLYCAISRKFRHTLEKMFHKRRVMVRRDTWTTSAMPLSDNSTTAGGTLRTRHPTTTTNNSYTPPPSTGSSHESSASHPSLGRVK